MIPVLYLSQSSVLLYVLALPLKRRHGLNPSLNRWIGSEVFRLNLALIPKGLDEGGLVRRQWQELGQPFLS